MASSFPGTLDSFATNRSDATVMATNQAADHNNYADAVTKIETKVGTGASTPVANSLLAGTGTGASGWSTDPALTSIALGTNPSATGVIRIPNNQYVMGRNAANSGDINLLRVNASDRLQTSAPLVIGQDAGLGCRSLSVYVDQTTQIVDRPTNPGVNVYLQAKQAALVTGGNTAIQSVVLDRTDVTQMTITAMSRSGTTITATAASHGYANGDNLMVYGVTHTFNAEVNGLQTISNVTTNTFDYTVPGLSSGTYTSGGTATNRGLLYAANFQARPRLARTGVNLAGASQFFDDVACVSMKNDGTAKGTDCLYIGGTTNFAGSEWYNAIKIDADADSAVSFSGAYNNGLVCDGTYTEYGINLKSGTYTGGAIALKNNSAIKGRNNANSSDLTMISINTADEMSMGTIVRMTLTTRYAEGANQSFGTGAGTQIGTAAGQKLGLWGVTPIIQPSGTGETAGFVAGAGTAVNDQSTFTGNVGTKAYRISDIVKALKNSGIMAAS